MVRQAHVIPLLFCTLLSSACTASGPDEPPGSAANAAANGADLAAGPAAAAPSPVCVRRPEQGACGDRGDYYYCEPGEVLPAALACAPSGHDHDGKGRSACCR
jgi:hypothetical protein